MKKVCALLTAAFCLINVTLKAQDTTQTSSSSTKILGGFMIAPQGGLSLKNAETGTEVFSPIFIVVTIVKGNWVITPFYNMTAKSTGLALEYAVTPNMGAYVVGTKNSKVRGGYAGFGVDTPVFDGYGSMFIEYGSDWGTEYNPYLYAGVFIPLTKKLSK